MVPMSDDDVVVIKVKRSTRARLLRVGGMIQQRTGLRATNDSVLDAALAAIEDDIEAHEPMQ
jgi:hypothetical protein